MAISHITVTRWLNEEQQFVQVGKLFCDYSLNREYPLVGFDYDEDYLAKHPPLTPIEMKVSRTALNDSSWHDHMPVYFKQFLPSEDNKKLYNKMNIGFEGNQFEQLSSIVKLKGDFGPIQFNYGDEHQHNKVLKIGEAIQVLDDALSGNTLSEEHLSALVSSDSTGLVVNSFIDVEGVKLLCTISRCENEIEAKKVLAHHELQKACLIDTPLTFHIQNNDHNYIGQAKDNIALDKNNGKNILRNRLNAAAIVSQSKRVTTFETLSYEVLAKVLTDITDCKLEVFKRGVFNHIMKQKTADISSFAIDEADKNSWVLASKPASYIQSESNQPFAIPLLASDSIFEHLHIDDQWVHKASNRFGLDESDVKKVLNELGEGFNQFSAIVMKNGLTAQQVQTESSSIKQSGIHQYIPNNQQDINKGPTFDV